MTDTPTNSDLQRFAELWEAAELPKKSIAPVTVALLRSEAIAREGDAEAAATRAGPAEIARSIAEGELSVAEGLDALRDTPADSPLEPMRPRTGWLGRKGDSHRRYRQYSLLLGS